MENKRMDYAPSWIRYLPMIRRAKLTREQMGDLWLAMLEYQAEDKEPEELDQVCEIFWCVILEDLKRARLKYEQAVEKGKKGGRPSKKPEKAEESREKQEKGRTTTKTTTTSTTESTSTSATETTSTASGSAPAQDAGVCCEADRFGEFGWVKLTQQQYRSLMDRYGPEELHRCITYVDEAAQCTGNRNRWKDWYLVIRRCHENRWYERGRTPPKDEIPKGASGVLGEAELEAIARVLRE